MLKLENRAVIKIAGSDSAQFLHNITTNDVLSMQPQSSIYNLILNSKGRFLFDFFLVKRETHFLIDCYKDDAEAIVELLRMYRVLLKVKIKICEEYFVAVDTKKRIGAEGETVVLETDVVEFQDPRCAALGVRYIAKMETETSELPIQNQDDYNRLLISNTVPDCAKCMISGESFPLHFCLDRLNAISYTKGCYMGQEVVARMYRVGPKKMLYTVIAEEGKSLPASGEVTFEGQPVGQMLDSSGAMGLCLFEVAQIPQQEAIFLVAGVALAIKR